MSNQKKFGIWIDNGHATIMEKEGEGQSSPYTLIATVKSEHVPSNSNEQAANNHERTLHAKYFKEIASHITNADVVHITGTGDAQEQFIHFLSETPQFKNTKTSESTSNKMSDEKLAEYFQQN